MRLLDLIVATLLVWSTCFMTGLIWFVQIVHYPLFANVPKDGFSAYEEVHQTKTSLVVGPVMLVEAITSGLTWYRSDSPETSTYLFVGLLLLLLIWLVTALVSMPAHQRLSKEFDENVHRRLVATNWIRTVSWSLRSVLVSSIFLSKV